MLILKPILMKYLHSEDHEGELPKPIEMKEREHSPKKQDEVRDLDLSY
jgi:hypothetical protein